jgi:hypothetical protein
MALSYNKTTKAKLALQKCVLEGIDAVDEGIKITASMHRRSFRYRMYHMSITVLAKNIKKTIEEFPEIMHELKAEQTSEEGNTSQIFNFRTVRMISYFLPPEHADNAEMHLEDRHKKWTQRFGINAANRRVQWHALTTVIAYHSANLRKIALALAALAGLKRFGDWFGRKFF